MLKKLLEMLESFLLYISGTDLQLLNKIESGNRTGHSRQVRVMLGALILLTFFVTWGSSTWTATTFGFGIYLGAVVALLPSAIKITWDRRVAVAATTRVAWWRMVLALPISFLLALPIALSLFGSYATGVSKHEEETIITKKYDRQVAEREELQAEYDSLQSAGNFFGAMATAEVNGLTSKQAGITPGELRLYGVEAPSGAIGCGRRCKTYQERAKSYEEALKAVAQRLNSLPTQDEIRARREREQNELAASSVDAITLLSGFYDQARQRPMIGLLFLVLMAAYAFVDLLPALERIFATDRYTKEQIDRIESDRKRSEIQRSLAELKPRLAIIGNWVWVMIIDDLARVTADDDLSRQERKEKLQNLRERREQLQELQDMKEQMREQLKELQDLLEEPEGDSKGPSSNKPGDVIKDPEQNAGEVDLPDFQFGDGFAQARRADGGSGASQDDTIEDPDTAEDSDSSDTPLLLPPRRSRNGRDTDSKG